MPFLINDVMCQRSRRHWLMLASALVFIEQRCNYRSVFTDSTVICQIWKKFWEVVSSLQNKDGRKRGKREGFTGWSWQEIKIGDRIFRKSFRVCYSLYQVSITPLTVWHHGGINSSMVTPTWPLCCVGAGLKTLLSINTASHFFVEKFPCGATTFSFDMK